MIEVWNNTIHEMELGYFHRAIDDRHIMEGPVLKSFEQRLSELLGVPYVIGTASGSAALALALMAIGIKPGDEVIIPDLTFIATANAVCLRGGCGFGTYREGTSNYGFKCCRRSYHGQDEGNHNCRFKRTYFME